MPKISVVAEKELYFDAPFGEGPDLHTNVRAASSLLRFGRGWLIAQDDSDFAAYWTLRGIEPVRLIDEESAEAYAETSSGEDAKADLECGALMTLAGKHAAVFFGSGSRPSRMRAAIVTRNRTARSAVELNSSVVEIPSLYTSAMVALGLISDALNLEGACQIGDSVRFFQREAGANATFDVRCSRLAEALLSGAQLRPSDIENIRRYDLGSIDGAPLGFSAATALPDGRVLFAAVAEDSPNTLDDGMTIGSAIGLLDASQELVATARVPADEVHAPRKIEGISCERFEGDRASLLSVCDPDRPTLAALATWLDLVLRR